MKKNKKNSSNQIEIKTKTISLWWWLPGILLLTIIAYLPAFNNSFTDWDDTYYVTSNTNIRSLSFQSILAFFTSLQTQGNYHPLTLLSLAIDYKLFGLSATGYHTVNIFLHLINVCLVFVLIQKLFKTEFITIVTTVLFAIHPMHVESVAWISERKDVLYAFFYLMGLFYYATYLESGKKKFIICTVLCFVLSLLSKAQAVTFPLALMVVYYIRYGKLSIKTILVYAPMLVLSVITGIVAIHAQRAVNANDLYIHYTALDRIVYTCYAFTLYILKLFLPINLAVLYPYPDKINGVFNGLVYLSIIVPIGFVALICFMRKNGIVLSGLLFFLINIALLLQLLPVGDAIIAERYTYLSYLGLFWALAYGVHYLVRKEVKLKTGIIALCCCYVIFLTYCSYQRTMVWQDSVSLWNDELEKFSNVPIAWLNLGMIKESNNDSRGAKDCFTKAILYDPDYATAFSDRSLAYTQLGLYDSAIRDDNTALKFHFNIKAAHQNRGVAYALSGKTDSSLMDCDWLVSNFPNDTSAHMNRGLACYYAQKYDSAVEEFSWIITRSPAKEAAYANRGLANMLLNKLDDAMSDYDRALEINPDDWEVYGNRAHTRFLQKDYKNAIDDATIAINNSHGNPTNNYITRAQACANMGRYEDALRDYLTMQKIGVTVPSSIITSLEKKTGTLVHD